MGPYWPGTRVSLPCPSRYLKQRLTPPTERPRKLRDTFLHWPWTELSNCPLSSETDLGSTVTHFFPPAITSSPMPHLPPGLTSSHCSCLQPEEGRRSHSSPTEGPNTHCALEVSKSPSAGGLYVSSPKSFDLAKPHATPKAHHGETLLAPSQQNLNKPPDSLTI